MLTDAAHTPPSENALVSRVLKAPNDDASEVWATTGFFEVSTAVRLLGDRWSLLIVREVWIGNTRFSEIHSALPGLSRSLLSTRLRYLERLRIIERRESTDVDRRCKQWYSLTDVGAGLTPVLRELGAWALAWQVPDVPDVDHDVVTVMREMQASIDVSVMPKSRMLVQLYFSDSSHSAGYLRVDRNGARGCLGLADEAPDLIVRTTALTLHNLYWGRRSCQDALFRRDISFEGPSDYAQRFPSWFPDRPANRVPTDLHS